MQKISLEKSAYIIFSILILCFAVASLTFAAWTTPTSAPPGNNAPAPLNVGDTPQLKGGSLSVNTDNLYQNGLLIPYGNVGIGTLTPHSPLEVTEPTGTSGALLQRWSYGGQTVFRLDLKQVVSSQVVQYSFSQTNAGTNYDNTLVLDRGKVGIGVTSPDAKLAVIGDGTSVARIGGTGCGGSLVGIGFFGAMNCNNYTLVGNPLGNNLFINRPTGGNIFFRENNFDQLFIQATTGYLGIGTTAPSNLLSVGSGNKFQVNSSGDIVKIKNITYSWPLAQGSADTYLKNNGSGGLSWAPGGGGTVTINANDGLTGGGANQTTFNLAVGQGSGISVTADAVSHGNTSTIGAGLHTIANSVITGITTDAFGHITGITTATISQVCQ